jgi:hypothetical protein
MNKNYLKDNSEIRIIRFPQHRIKVKESQRQQIRNDDHNWVEICSGGYSYQLTLNSGKFRIIFLQHWRILFDLIDKNGKFQLLELFKHPT